MPGQATDATKTPRYGWLDTARGIAVLAMSVFHFAWDLEFFGYADAGMTAEPGWRWFARAIAASFLILAGFSFVVAHRNGFDRRRFLVRLAQIAAAAALISFGTWLTTPDRFVFFGILHQIAFASLLAAMLLPLNALILGIIAAAIFLVNLTWTSELFTTPFLWWVGLAPFDPPTNDYVPVFPWSGWVIAGMAAAKSYGAKYAAAAAPDAASSLQPPARPVAVARFLGRHSLIYYLVHQPVMIGLLFVVSWFAPPPPPDLTAGFRAACMNTCTADRNRNFCGDFCDCVASDLKTGGIFEPVAKGDIGIEDERVSQAARTCTTVAQEKAGD